MKKRKNRKTAADRADPHVLYQKSVQCVEAECDWIEEEFHRIRGRRPSSLREDFCGTANAACEWVRRSRTHDAVGVDLDEAVLAWAREHNIAALGKPAARRIRLIRGDVLRVRTDPVDVIVSMNFSWQVFKTRSLLRRYFRSVRASLAPDGVYLLDAYGGYDSFREISEKRDCGKFTYIWEHASYNPITGDLLAHIHFRFPDGSRLDRAFTYDWRLWTLPELREILAEAGFSNVVVHWEGTDEDTGEGDGVYRPAVTGDPDPSWVCYLSAEK